MSDPGFREIQLSTKQVVFLLIAVVTAGIGVFLLGVSTGKGLAKEPAGEVVQTPDTGGDMAGGGANLPATSPKPDEFKYHNELQKKADAAPPTPPDAPPEATPNPTPAATSKPVPPPATKPEPSKPAPASPSKTPAPASGGYFLQVNSFGSRANASRQVAELKARGISAFIFESPDPGPKFRVRVGPLADSAAAEVMRARLRKEGYEPSLVIR